jgi:peptidyl-prolyl cis-trans isomerase C
VSTATAEVDATTPLPDPLPAIAAQVDGYAIPMAFVKIAAERLREGRPSEADRPWAYRQALQQLVARELLVQEALARGIAADDKEVQAAYDEARLPHRDENEWAAFLAKQGLTGDTFRAQIRAELTAQALIAKETADLPSTVSEEEARVFYAANPALFESGERIRVAHILLRFPPGASPGQRAALQAQAAGIAVRLRKGADFEKLAKELSEDRATAGKGGELPPVRRGQLDPAFEAAAFALKPGEISDVVQTRFGFHVVKMIEQRPSERLAYEAVRERVKQYVVASRRQERVQKLVASLRAKAKIEIHL